jgi:hypothetical protein
MSKVAGISLLVLGASAVAYAFLIKKEKKLTNEEILIGKGAESTCDLLQIKLDLVNSEIANMNPEFQSLYKKQNKTNDEQKRFKELGDLAKILNDQRTELNQLKAKDCSSLPKREDITCKGMDMSIKEYSDNIALWQKELLKPNGQRIYYTETLKILIDKYNIGLLKLKNEFVDKKCRDVLEKKNLNESGYLLSTQAEKQEQNVLLSNYKEQYLYIGLGSVVLLTGLYIISKK